MAGPMGISAAANELWLKVQGLFPNARMTSGARSPSSNSGIAGASKTSQHLTGDAFDFVVPGMDPKAVQQTIVASGLSFGQSIAEYGAGMGPRNHLGVGTKGQVMTAQDGKYRTTQFTGLNLDGKDYAQKARDFLGGTVADVLKAPGDAVDSFLADPLKSVSPDLNSWFQRIAVAVFALIFIAAAVFAFKGSDAINLVSKAKGLTQ